MNKTERAAFEMAWVRFARSMCLPSEFNSDEASAERNAFEGGWKAALRAAARHRARQNAPSGEERHE